jgi:hypothetical protein
LNTEINLRTHDSSVSIIPPMGILFDWICRSTFIHTLLLHILMFSNCIHDSKHDNSLYKTSKIILTLGKVLGDCCSLNSNRSSSML